MKKPLERDVLRQALDWLNLSGAYAFRLNTAAFPLGAGGSRRFVRAHGAGAGASDIIGLLPGGRFRPPRPCATFLAVECKRPGRKATAAQESFLARVRALGGVGLCVDSLDALRAALAREGYLA